ncbi:MAG TPA: SIR2 family protein [Streptosporangiaceae bacterium]
MHDLATEVGRADPADVLALSGAGVSLDPPASLPDGGTLTRRVFAAFLTPDALDTVTARHLAVGWRPARPCPRGRATGDAARLPRLETVLGVAAETCGEQSVADILADVCEARPNFLHEIFAAHLARGGRHITANFDGCIEKAADNRFAGWRGRGQIFHFHGSLADDPSGLTLGATLARIQGGFSDEQAAVIRGMLVAARFLVVLGYSGSDFFDFDTLIAALPADALAAVHVIWISHSGHSWHSLDPGSRTLPPVIGLLRRAGARVSVACGPTTEFAEGIARSWGLAAAPRQAPDPALRTAPPPVVAASPAQRRIATFQLYRELGLPGEVAAAIGTAQAAGADPAAIWLARSEMLWEQGRWNALRRIWARGPLPPGVGPALRAERIGACLWVQGRLVPAYLWLTWHRRHARDPQDRMLLAETEGRVIEHMHRVPPLNLLAAVLAPRMAAVIGGTSQRAGIHLHRRRNDLVSSLRSVSGGTRDEAEAQASSQWFAEAGSLLAALSYRHRQLRDTYRAARLSDAELSRRYRELQRHFAAVGSASGQWRTHLLPGAERVFRTPEVLHGLFALQYGWRQRAWLLARFVPLRIRYQAGAAAARRPRAAGEAPQPRQPEAGRTARASELLVFAGAGVSMPMPSGRPSFNELRGEILRQLGLERYLSHPAAADQTAAASPAAADDFRPAVAERLAPEPFMLALARAGVAIEEWIRQVIGQAPPNAAHQVIARLAENGARVWTVNFDDMIERGARPGARCVAWPADPHADGLVMKPHGTIGGELIVTAEQVLAPLRGDWLDRLRRDAAGRTVIFVGYSGRDLDFQPVWDDVLEGAAGAWWFDYWDAGRPRDEAFKRGVLRRADERGALRFSPPAPPPAAFAGAPGNPSWDFIAWCQDRGLELPDGLDIGGLLGRRAGVSYPPLPGDVRWARPAVLGMLGDYRAERRAYLLLLLHPRYLRRAVRALGNSVLNHGGDRIAAVLALGRLLPAAGAARRWRERARLKRAAIWARTGRHAAVLRITRDAPGHVVSTELILRSAALRMTGSLDDAAGLARAAREQAIGERHPVRVANAAFQECLALLWAERLAEARRCLEDDFEPYAAIAATRWIAWADFIGGGLAIRAAVADGGDGTEALRRLALSERRFEAEALADGVVSVMTARLAAHRLRGDDCGFEAELAGLARLRAHGERGQRYYTRGNAFTDQTIVIERAEFARMHERRPERAWRLYGQAAASRYPLQAALGHLGLGLVEAGRGREPLPARTAADIAGRIGARLVRERAGELLARPGGESLREVFFC